MRETLLSIFTADQLEWFGLCILLAGLIGELLVLPIPERRTKLIKSMSTICVIAIIVGIWFEHVGAEANKAPRRLNASQQQILATKMKMFVAQPFVVLSEMHSEPMHFALDIADVLKRSGWEWKPHIGGLSIAPLDGRPAVGMSVLDHIEIQAHSSKATSAAKALASTFEEIKLKDIRLVVTDDRTDDNTVYFIIGTK